MPPDLKSTVPIHSLEPDLWEYLEPIVIGPGGRCHRKPFPVTLKPVVAANEEIGHLFEASLNPNDMKKNVTFARKSSFIIFQKELVRDDAASFQFFS